MTTTVEPASTVYPAFAPDAPQVMNNGGLAPLAAPLVATVTWNDDPFAADFEAFDDGVGATSYWKLTGEYGIGASKGGDHVRASGLPATITDDDITNLVQKAVTGAPSSGWAANSQDRVYTVFLPPDTTLLRAGDGPAPTPACDVFDAFHFTNEPAAVDGGSSVLPVRFIVVPRCPGSTLDTMTRAAARELANIAADPSIAAPAYFGFDVDHLAYDLYSDFLDEIGSACQIFPGSTLALPPPFAFTVQRLWSDRSARLGHDPCVPWPVAANYNTTTFAADRSTVNVDLLLTFPAGSCVPASACTIPTKGISVPLGQSRTFEIGFFSDAPTAPWTVSAVTLPTLPVADASGTPLKNGAIDVVIDEPRGANGHKAKVTVTPHTAGDLGVEYFELHSGAEQANAGHTLPIVVGQP